MFWVCCVRFFLRKGKRDFDVFYLRFRKMSAATAAMTITTAAVMAMYVVVGIPLVGGSTAWLGDGDGVGCVGWVGATVGSGGDAVGTTCGLVVGASDT